MPLEKKHGFATPSDSQEYYTYVSWKSMRQRCNYEHHKSYDYYGGAGVSVCDRWEDFGNFLLDMGLRPDGATVGRLDNSKGYEPGNCQWETATQQARNRRTSRFLEAFGQRKTIAEWVEEYKIPHDTLCFRLKLGWPPEEALTKPRRKMKNLRNI